MPKTKPPLYRMLALGRSSHADLLHQIHYLTVENRILRSKLPDRIRLTERERRRLIRSGKPVGSSDASGMISVMRHRFRTHRPSAPTECIDETMAAVLRDKTPAERLAIADGMWRSARSMIEHMLQSEHADWSRDQVRRETARRLSHGAI